MSRLPIIHMTLYKHGVGFFQRRGPLEGEAIKLTFRREEMDDLLKSLTVIDHSGGQVRGVDYDTPQSKTQRLSGCSVILGDRRSLRDLLTALRGREVQLRINDGSHIDGTLLGLDEAKEKPLKRLIVSILQKDTDATLVVSLDRLEGVELRDTTASEDLRFFLETATGQETHRSITIRLNPGSHDLEVSYIAPAPGWRVSYRLVTETTQTNDNDEPAAKALLQGWGIFDNRLEEDLTGISLSLTAGMPISFIYDLYTPHTPKRPVVKEENRVAAAPIMFEAMAEESFEEALDAPMAAAAAPMMKRKAIHTQMGGAQALSMDAMEGSIENTATGEAMGELFQYKVNVPVTVGRGQSAMVPILSHRLEEPGKALIYNGAKMATHPVATLRFKNTTGLTLERGPVTVLENGEYVGEAVLPFTSGEAETVISYAIELGVHVKEQQSFETQLHGLSIKDRFLVHQRYDIRATCYRIDNRTPRDKTILIERPLDQRFEPFDTPEPEEKTLETYRYKVDAPAGELREFNVRERWLRAHHEALNTLSYNALQKYFDGKYLDKRTYNELKGLLDAMAEISRLENVIQQQENRRKTIYHSQDQIQKKMAMLAKDGEEGRLRGRYVKQLTEKEEQLEEIETVINQTRTEIERKNAAVDQLIAQLGKKD
ncbi:MAG: DUF4139 domain-containing protein [bacterium]|nr:DUF4139 domain-containing protein [bacterium]